MAEYVIPIPADWVSEDIGDRFQHHLTTNGLTVQSMTVRLRTNGASDPAIIVNSSDDPAPFVETFVHTIPTPEEDSRMTSRAILLTYLSVESPTAAQNLAALRALARIVLRLTRDGM